MPTQGHRCLGPFTKSDQIFDQASHLRNVFFTFISACIWLTSRPLVILCLKSHLFYFNTSYVYEYSDKES